MKIVRICSESFCANKCAMCVFLAQFSENRIDLQIVLSEFRIFFEVFQKITQSTDENGKIGTAKLFAESVHDGKKSLCVKRIIVTEAIVFSLVPEDPFEGRCAHSKLCAIHGVIEQDLSRHPLGDLCSSVCAGNDAYFNVGVRKSVFFGEAFRKANARGVSVGIHGAKHRNPKSVSLNL